MDRLGAPSPAQARSTLARLMRAELGMRVARGHAKLIIARARERAAGSARRTTGGAGRVRGDVRQDDARRRWHAHDDDTLLLL
jgi:hypothetical protein